jgi:hypothetical protein
MESVETLNQRLIDHYGVDSNTNQPQFRIVFSDEQFEKRLVGYTPEGLHLLHPVIREMPKYSYIDGMYLLERLVIIDEPELPGVKLSYEPVWVFRDVHNNPLPPIWDAAKIVIDVLYAALGKKSLNKYVENEDSLENKEKRIKKLEEELFGNETEVTDALSYREGVAGFHKKEN